VVPQLYCRQANRYDAFCLTGIPGRIASNRVGYMSYTFFHKRASPDPPSLCAGLGVIWSSLTGN
jgi:hypothetical protein